jgi:L-lactate dehydrogenase complex protein LldE
MIRKFYAELFHGQALASQAEAFGKRVFEFSEFLHYERLVDKLHGRATGKVAFHNSCHSCRELGLTHEGLDLVKQIVGYELVEPISSSQVCCGFGGLFSIKFEGIAKGIAKSRLEAFIEAGAETIVSNDPGCIMHLRKEVELLDAKVRVVHVTEFLAEAMGLTH